MSGGSGKKRFVVISYLWRRNLKVFQLDYIGWSFVTLPLVK